MRLVINLILIALVAALAFLLIDSIQEPIAFKAVKDFREEVVQNKLVQIRDAQEHYRSITGEFAHNFDTLKEVLSTQQFAIVSVMGDADDPNNSEITYDTTFVNAADSIAKLNINLDSLRYVPFADGVEFEIQADTLTYQSTLVNVVEVGTRINKFMGDYSNPRFKRYDNSYDPNTFLKFGDMNKPSTAGSW